MKASFPIAPDPYMAGPTRRPGSSCSMADAERAYAEYVKRYGRCQTLERIRQRGGFYREEMDELAPGWKEVER